MPEAPGPNSGVHWVGRRVRAALGPPGIAELITVHRGGFWVSGACGIVGLLRLPAPRGIRFAGLDPSLPLPAAAVKPAAPRILWDGERLVWTAADGTRIACGIGKARCWDPQPLEPPPRLPRGLAARADLGRRLLALLAPRTLDVPEKTVAALPRAAASGDGAALAAAAGALLGRGGGLTPTGDDVLAGFAALSPPAVREAVRRCAAAPRTTRLSRDLLADACDGYLLEPAAEFGRWLLGEGDDGPAEILARLLRVGHQSGLGLATGLLAAADLLAQGIPGPA